MSSYLLAFTLLTGQAAKILLMAIWMSLAILPLHCKQLVQARAMSNTNTVARANDPVHCTLALPTAHDT